MGANKEDIDGMDNAWKRNPMPGDTGDVKGSNFLMVALIISAIGLLVAIGFV